MPETLPKQISFWVYLICMLVSYIFQRMARRSNGWWATAFCQFRPSISQRNWRAVTASDCWSPASLASGTGLAQDVGNATKSR
jgi:hypothetical protein